jgi:hypothetical protein
MNAKPNGLPMSLTIGCYAAQIEGRLADKKILEHPEDGNLIIDVTNLH